MELLWLLCLVPIAFFWCCAAVCEIHIDAFTRANSTDLGADWTEVSGDWSIASNKLSISAANAIVTSDPSAGDSFSFIEVLIALGAAASGSAGRILFDYTDSSNYMFAEIKAGTATSGHFKIVRKAAGVDTELYTFTLAVSGTLTLTVCYDQDSLLLVRLKQTVYLATCQISATLTSSVVGLGTGSWAAPAPAILFDDFTRKHRVDGCQDCPYHTASGCTGAAGSHNISNEMQLDVTGFANQDCLNCASLNATYICKANTGAGTTFELYQAAVCQTDRVQVNFGISGNDGTVNASFHILTAQQYGGSKTNTGNGKYDCKNLAATTLINGADSSTQCDFSGVTLTVTAV